MHSKLLNSTRNLLLSAMLVCVALSAQATETIKVGILHSLSGTMAISETSLKDVALMAIEEINANGGLLGKQIEPVVVAPPQTGLYSQKKPVN